MRVLIAEDEIIPANYLKKVLTKSGIEVIGIAAKGVDVIEIARDKKPDVILMDVMLKDGISGCDAALRVRFNNPEILIIFLTAYSDKEMVDFAVESKAFAYLLKPYRDREILATLELAKAHVKDRKIVHQTAPNSKEWLELVDGYMFNIETKTFLRNSKEIFFGPKALALIALLCEHRSSTVRIETILQTLWSEPTSQQTLRSLIHRIREQTSPNLIVNINKLGYKIGLRA